MRLRLHPGSVSNDVEGCWIGNLLCDGKDRGYRYSVYCTSHLRTIPVSAHWHLRNGSNFWVDSFFESSNRDKRPANDGKCFPFHKNTFLFVAGFSLKTTSKVAQSKGSDAGQYRQQTKCISVLKHNVIPRSPRNLFVL